MAKLKTPAVSLSGGLASFKATHDPKVVIPNKIRATLDAMAASNPEMWLPEWHENQPNFLKQAGLTKEEIRSHREAFDDHIVEVKKKGRSSVVRFWFADVKVAAKARS